MAPSVPWEEAAIAKFTEATGIQVTLTVGPQSATERLAQYQQFFAAQATDVDAMMIDVIWPGIPAAHAADLSEAIGWQGAEYFERIVNNNTIGDKLVGIPWYTDAGILYYRTDLLDKHGFDAPPETWTELEEMATAIQEAERPRILTSSASSGRAAYEGLTCDALEWQVSNGGGVIVEEDLTVSVNNPQGHRGVRARQGLGWHDLAGWRHRIYAEEDARGVWQAGNAAFMRNWPMRYAPGQDEGSAIKDKFAVTLVPMGEGEARSTRTPSAAGRSWSRPIRRISQRQSPGPSTSRRGSCRSRMPSS